MTLTIIVLFSILFAAQSAITDFWTSESIESGTLLCLQQKNYFEEVFLRAEFNAGTQEWQSNIDPREIEKLGTKPHLVLSTFEIDGQLPPLLEARRIFRNFEDSPVSKFWISLSTFQGSFKPSCNYLRKFASSLEQFSGKKVGFQTELLFWEQLMGNQFACPELAHRHDLFLSFSNFTLFGGWRSFSYYETYQTINDCDYPGMLVFKK
jgi:hypothetical protein